MMNVSMTRDEIELMAKGRNPLVDHPQWNYGIVIIFLAKRLIKCLDEIDNLKERNEVLNSTIQDVY
jgi:hypothetical protein